MLKLDNIILFMLSASMTDVRTAYIARVREENKRIKSLEKQLTGNGFVEVPYDSQLEDNESTYLPDGRVVLKSAGKFWAISKKAHDALVSEALEAAAVDKETKDTKEVLGTESSSPIVCKYCDDNVQRTKLCQSCQAAQLGYQYRYACPCGKTDFISRDAI
jgi:hypothetical protein